MNLVFSVETRDDLEIIADTVYRDYPGQAADILKRLQDALDHITRFPLVSALVEPKIRRRPKLRCFPIPRVGSRVIYFETHGNDIHVIRIIHEAMDVRRHLDQ